MVVEHQIEFRGEGNDHTLDEALSSLKKRGCSILVVGKVPVPTLRQVSHRLFGHPAERRERVLLRFRQTKTLDGWFARGVDLETPGVHVLDCTDLGRSTAGDVGSWRWNSQFDPAETPALSRREDLAACTSEIDAIAAEAGPLEPAQLRVGAFSLDALETPDRMVETASAVSETVTAHRGMVHYHLQQPPSREIDQRLLDHVDATLSVRKQFLGQPPEQKWTVPEYGETPWIELGGFE